MHLLWLFATGEKDNVSLYSLDVAVLEHKELVDAILLKRAEFDEESNWPEQVSLDHEVLSTTDLSWSALVALSRWLAV